MGISIHALLAESDWSNQPVTMHTWKFLSTLSLRRATRAANCQHRSHQISIHALLAESDLHCNTPKVFRHYFYPRSPCGERHFLAGRYIIGQCISIHALLAESDPLCLCGFSAGRISIHALLAESDPPRVIREPAPGRFLSTLSLRRATGAAFLI